MNERFMYQPEVKQLRFNPGRRTEAIAQLWRKVAKDLRRYSRIEH